MSPDQPEGERADDSLLYLSDPWLTEADAALSGLVPVPDEVTVGISVTGGPQGDRRYRLILGPDRVGVDPGPEPAGVTMTMAWPDAVAIAKGRASAQRAFLDGRLRLGGNTLLLLGHQDALAEIDDRLVTLRSHTRFDQQ